MEEFPIANRLKTLIASLGLSDSQFADTCSISRSTLSLLLSGKNKKISDVILSQIHEAFPKVSILWLLFGEGDKFHNEKQDSTGLKESEIPLFEEEDTDSTEKTNLMALNNLENIIQDIVNKSFNSSFKTLENLVIKTNEPHHQRKVSKITVYYGDSTFETFIPEDKNF